ncbi:hypothetical protein OBBRIDRAFT_801961 [Obba rivulosa]|uniref:Uncharacterized protein n=1 Tax=Obba rivulosa TaxID=1052685 RepID=A0A8E2DPF2_9APHY|nr:hypothetical protein OBBRIDRAFT_801961 [Obba rivulosa]
MIHGINDDLPSPANISFSISVECCKQQDLPGIESGAFTTSSSASSIYYLMDALAQRLLLSGVCESALDVLWRDLNSPIPLFRLFASYMHVRSPNEDDDDDDEVEDDAREAEEEEEEESGILLYQLGEILPDEWARFRHYARRVRSIAFKSGHECLGAISAEDMMLECILYSTPHIKHIDLVGCLYQRGTAQMRLECQKVLLELKFLGFFKRAASVLRSISSPNLRMLSLASSTMPARDPIIDDTLQVIGSRFVSSLRNLTISIIVPSGAGPSELSLLQYIRPLLRLSNLETFHMYAAPSLDSNMTMSDDDFLAMVTAWSNVIVLSLYYGRSLYISSQALAEFARHAPTAKSALYSRISVHQGNACPTNRRNVHKHSSDTGRARVVGGRRLNARIHPESPSNTACVKFRYKRTSHLTRRRSALEQAIKPYGPPSFSMNTYKILCRALGVTGEQCSCARFTRVNKAYQTTALNTLWRHFDGLWPILQLFSLDRYGLTAYGLHPGETVFAGMGSRTINVIVCAITTARILSFRDFKTQPGRTSVDERFSHCVRLYSLLFVGYTYAPGLRSHPYETRLRVAAPMSPWGMGFGG